MGRIRSLSLSLSLSLSAGAGDRRADEERLRAVLAPLIGEYERFLVELASRPRLRRSLESVEDAITVQGSVGSTTFALALGDRRWGHLTATELRVACLVGRGLGNNGIARMLSMAPETVKTHLAHVFKKCGVSTRVELARRLLLEEPDPRRGDPLPQNDATDASPN